MLMVCHPHLSLWWAVLYLDGLPKAALAKHLSMDEVRGSEDSVGFLYRVHTQGLRASHVPPLRLQRHSTLRKGGLIYTAATSERESENMCGRERKREEERVKVLLNV